MSDLPYICLCGQSFNNLTTIEDHVRARNEPSICALPCTCGKGFRTLESLKQHARDSPSFPISHCLVDTKVCDCGSKFKTVKGLLAHVQDMKSRQGGDAHTVPPSNPRSRPTPKEISNAETISINSAAAVSKFQCKCGKEFKALSSLKDHVQGVPSLRVRHGIPRPRPESTSDGTICECGKRFLFPDLLKSHIRDSPNVDHGIPADTLVVINTSSKATANHDQPPIKAESLIKETPPDTIMEKEPSAKTTEELPTKERLSQDTITIETPAEEEIVQKLTVQEHTSNGAFSGAPARKSSLSKKGINLVTSITHTNSAQTSLHRLLLDLRRSSYAPLFAPKPPDDKIVNTPARAEAATANSAPASQSTTGLLARLIGQGLPTSTSPTPVATADLEARPIVSLNCELPCTCGKLFTTPSLLLKHVNYTLRHGPLPDDPRNGGLTTTCRCGLRFITQEKLLAHAEQYLPDIPHRVPPHLDPTKNGTCDPGNVMSESAGGDYTCGCGEDLTFTQGQHLITHVELSELHLEWERKVIKYLDVPDHSSSATEPRVHHDTSSCCEKTSNGGLALPSASQPASGDAAETNVSASLEELEEGKAGTTAASSTLNVEEASSFQPTADTADPGRVPVVSTTTILNSPPPPPPPPPPSYFSTPPPTNSDIVTNPSGGQAPPRQAQRQGNRQPVRNNRAGARRKVECACGQLVHSSGLEAHERSPRHRNQLRAKTQEESSATTTYHGELHYDSDFLSEFGSDDDDLVLDPSEEGKGSDDNDDDDDDYDDGYSSNGTLYRDENGKIDRLAACDSGCDWCGHCADKYIKRDRDLVRELSRRAVQNGGGWSPWGDVFDDDDYEY